MGDNTNVRLFTYMNNKPLLRCVEYIELRWTMRKQKIIG